MKDFKKDYEDIKIPDSLNSVVDDTIHKYHEERKKQDRLNIIRKLSISTAAAILLTVVAVNKSEALASNLEKIPVLGSVIKVINFTNYNVESENKDAKIAVPRIEGLGDKKVEFTLNKEFEEEGKELFKEITNNQGKIAISSDYKVITDNEKYLTLKISTTEIQASSYNTAKYYTVDKKNNTVLSLKGIFSGKDYVNIISKNIKEQMESQMKNDSNKLYFIGENAMEDSKFERIKEDQSFYINDKNQLVISFDEYEVAPGYMGITEFIIPNDIL